MAQKFDILDNLDLWEEQVIFYRDHLDIWIEDQCAPVRLTRDQHVIAREFGRCSDVKIVQSRGSGKTWLMALCCHAMCCLYPGTIVLVCSATAGQGTLVHQKLKMLADTNINIRNELMATRNNSYVRISTERGIAEYKNGSKFISGSIQSLRGQRAKIIVVDETPGIDQEMLDAIVSPIRNFRREISFNNDFPDYTSKIVNITSACEKSNTFYDEFLRVVRQMAKGNRDAFACALDYRAAAANGITELSFFEAERARMPDTVFDMEYGSKFVGALSNTAFPYEIVETCRTLRKPELDQPKNTKSRYVLSVDLATSDAKGSDNTVISVIKFTEHQDGSYSKKLVYIRSYNGQKLDFITNEIRELYHVHFPSAEKIIYDARGLGDSLDRFFDMEYYSPTLGKEFPPLVVDDQPNVNHDALQILHPVRAVNSLNQRMYTNLRVALEQRKIELPLNSKIAFANDADSEKNKLTIPERAIFYETDALQFEMGNVVAKVNPSGVTVYDTARGLHKDRYSSLAMGIDYVCELEKTNIKRFRKGKAVIGFASDL